MDKQNNELIYFFENQLYFNRKERKISTDGSKCQDIKEKAIYPPCCPDT